MTAEGQQQSIDDNNGQLATTLNSSSKNTNTSQAVTEVLKYNNLGCKELYDCTITIRPRFDGSHSKPDSMANSLAKPDVIDIDLPYDDDFPPEMIGSGSICT